MLTRSATVADKKGNIRSISHKKTSARQKETPPFIVNRYEVIHKNSMFFIKQATPTPSLLEKSVWIGSHDTQNVNKSTGLYKMWPTAIFINL